MGWGGVTVRWLFCVDRMLILKCGGCPRSMEVKKARFGWALLGALGGGKKTTTMFQPPRGDRGVTTRPFR